VREVTLLGVTQQGAAFAQARHAGRVPTVRGDRAAGVPRSDPRYRHRLAAHAARSRVTRCWPGATCARARRGSARELVDARQGRARRRRARGWRSSAWRLRRARPACRSSSRCAPTPSTRCALPAATRRCSASVWSPIAADESESGLEAAARARSALPGRRVPEYSAAVKPATRDRSQEPAARSAQTAARCADARRARGQPASASDFDGAAPVARTGASAAADSLLRGSPRTIRRTARAGATTWCAMR
jgi:hypothetical protein